MPFDPLASVDENVAVVVHLPDGTEFGPGPNGQLFVLLTGKAEERDPLKYAVIFGTAKDHPAATPWMHFACWAEFINGMRRVTGSNMSALADELDSLVEEASNLLPSSRATHLLLGGVLWNAALVRRGLRRYVEAATAQRQSSAWYGIAGDVPKQLVGLFAAQVEEVTAAFVSDDAEAVRRSTKALVAMRNYIRFALPDYPGWMKDNASLHIGWALMMSALAYRTSDWLEHLGHFNTGRASRFAAWAQVFRLWDAYVHRRHGEIVNETPVATPSSSADNTALTVQIFRALAERELGHASEAEARLRAVAAYSGPDGGIPITVAKRLLV